MFTAISLWLWFELSKWLTMLSIILCTYWLFLCSLQRNDYSNHETIFKWVIVFLLSSCESYLCVLDVGALSHIWYVHIFSASSWFSFYFNSVLQEAKVFNWIKFSWWGFLVWIRHLVYLRSLCPSQDCKDNFRMFLFRIFIVWVLILWSVSQSFELIFVYGMWASLVAQW